MWLSNTLIKGILQRQTQLPHKLLFLLLYSPQLFFTLNQSDFCKTFANCIWGGKQHKQSLPWPSRWVMIGTPADPLCSRLLRAFSTPNTELPQGFRVSSFIAVTFSTILTRLTSENLPTSKVALLLTPQIFFIIDLRSIFFPCICNSIRSWRLRIFCTKQSPSIFRTKHLAELLCKRINHFKQLYH